MGIYYLKIIQMDQLTSYTETHFVDRNLKSCTKPRYHLHFIRDQTNSYNVEN
jgi:hypothetical protein